MDKEIKNCIKCNGSGFIYDETLMGFDKVYQPGEIAPILKSYCSCGVGVELALYDGKKRIDKKYS